MVASGPEFAMVATRRTAGRLFKDGAVEGAERLPAAGFGAVVESDPPPTVTEQTSEFDREERA